MFIPSGQLWAPSRPIPILEKIEGKKGAWKRFSFTVFKLSQTLYDKKNYPEFFVRFGENETKTESSSKLCKREGSPSTYACSTIS